MHLKTLKPLFISVAIADEDLIANRGESFSYSCSKLVSRLMPQIKHQLRIFGEQEARLWIVEQVLTNRLKVGQRIQVLLKQRINTSLQLRSESAQFGETDKTVWTVGKFR